MSRSCDSSKGKAYFCLLSFLLFPPRSYNMKQRHGCAKLHSHVSSANMSGKLQQHHWNWQPGTVLKRKLAGREAQVCQELHRSEETLICALKDKGRKREDDDPGRSCTDSRHTDGEECPGKTRVWCTAQVEGKGSTSTAKPTTSAGGGWSSSWSYDTAKMHTLEPKSTGWTWLVGCLSEGVLSSLQILCNFPGKEEAGKTAI